MELRLKTLRKARGWTQEHLQDVSGVSKSFISQIENAQRLPSMETMDMLAKALGVDIPELFDAGELSGELSILMDILKTLSKERRGTLLRVGLDLRKEQGA